MLHGIIHLIFPSTFTDSSLEPLLASASFMIDVTCMSYIYRNNRKESGVYRVLLEKPEGRRPLGRPRRRWVDNIRKDLQEVGCRYMDWIGLAQDRDRWRTFVSAVMNLQLP